MDKRSLLASISRRPAPGLPGMPGMPALLTLLVALPLVALPAQEPEDPTLRDFRWRSVGPANMSGRIVDIDAAAHDFTTAVAASASGGVWKTVNAGTTWEPIFDSHGEASIGDVAIAPSDPNVIWIGTGEANNRNSVGWGHGVFRSTDGGKTFEPRGLADTFQIARVVIHPTDPDVVYVAAAGNLWGASGSRGLYKTTDGGAGWTRLQNGLPRHDAIGAQELALDPKNPHVLYVCMYQRRRTPYRYDGGSLDSGIYKSTDGGKSFWKLTKGLPTVAVGRVGLDVYRKDPRILVAIVEAAADPEDEKYPGDFGTARGAIHSSLREPRSGVYRSEDGGHSWRYLNTFNNRPFYFSQIRINPVDPQRVYVLAQGFWQSADGGTTLQRGGRGHHGDYHAMWIDPRDPDRYYIGSDGGVALTHDHGESLVFFDNFAIGQFYAVGVDMREPYFVYGGLQDNGTWGGPSNSRDRAGILTDHWFRVGGGDGFYAEPDPRDWRTIYVESQGGRISRTDVLTRESKSIRPRKENVTNWDEHVADPAPEFYGRGPFRFNWNAPIHISPHDSETVWFGGNHLFRSIDRGDHWNIVSPDLTGNDPDKMLPSGGITPDNTAAEFHCTIVTISESPVREGLVWIGTDDGVVQVTQDGGDSWTDVSENISGVPPALWVSRVEASHHDAGTCYLTFDGHRSDDFRPRLYRTTDSGETWESIANDLPDGHTLHVVREDAHNPDLLFVGSEFEVFCSTDGGAHWQSLLLNMPPVAFHDLKIHPRDGDLIAGTHGRSVWILDDITPLQQLTPDVRRKPAHLFEPRPAVRWLSIGRGGSRGHLLFRGENPPRGATIAFWLDECIDGDVTLEIVHPDGEKTFTTKLDAVPGLSRYTWNMRFPPPQRESAEAGGAPARTAGPPPSGGGPSGRSPSRSGRFGRERFPPLAEPGQYTVRLHAGAQTQEQTLLVRPDPLLGDEK